MAVSFLHNMGYKKIDTAIVERMNEFISTLNHESENGSIIVVEGKRDSEALTNLDFLVKSLYITDSRES